MTNLPGKQYASCSHCGRLVQTYPVDRALMVWCTGETLCSGCAAGEGRHEAEEDGDEEE